MTHNIIFSPKILQSDELTDLTVQIRMNELDLDLPPEVKEFAKKLGLKSLPELLITIINQEGSKKLSQAIKAGQIKLEIVQEIIDRYGSEIDIWQTLDYFALDKTYPQSESENIPPNGQLRRSIINLIHAPLVEAMIEEININIETKKFKLKSPFLYLTLFTFGRNHESNSLKNPQNYANALEEIKLENEQDFEAANPRQIKIENPEEY